LSREKLFCQRLWNWERTSQQQETVNAWKKLIHIRYDFDAMIDFSISGSNRALNLLSVVRLQESTGNNTGRKYLLTIMCNKVSSATF
jgi:hypothetical protein